MSMRDLLTSPKVASAVSGTTVASGVSTVLDWIPDDIGKLATLVGIALSVVLIYTHIRAGLLNHKKIKLEIDELIESKKKRPV